MAQQRGTARRGSTSPPRHRGQPARSGVPVAQVAWRSIVLGAIALAVAFELLDFLHLLARPLAILLAAIVLAEALAPVVGWLERRLPRGLAIGLVYLLLLALVAGLGWLLLPPLVEQAQTLVANWPELLERARGWLYRFDQLGGDRLAAAVQSRLGGLLSTLMALPLALFTSVTELVLVIAMSAYWLAAAPALRRFALSLFPARQRERAGDVLGEMGVTMGGYVRGALLNALIIGSLTYVGLLVIGLDYPLVLALVAGVLEVVPIIGPIVAAVPALAIALLDSPTKALIVLGFYVALQQLEGNLVTPYVMRSQSDIPALLVLFAVFAGGTVGGVLWALVAIPLAGALQVLVLRVVAPAVRRWSGATERVQEPGGPGEEEAG